MARSRTPPRDELERLYRALQARQASSLADPALSDLIGEILAESIHVLARYNRAELQTKIPDKTYFAFESRDGKISRAINSALYQPSPQDWNLFIAALRSENFAGIDEHMITCTIYSVAIGFCAYIDLTRTGDQKTPGTFFEYLIGHLFGSRLDLAPSTRLPVLNLDMNTTLPTDFVFDLGAGQPKFHLPIKTSTRERVIQVWAHQRVLDGVYGTGRFLGTPVILAETKTDTRRREVTEICLPDQWRIYQMHIAQLRRVYYLDVPAAYERLNEVFPPLHVVPFGKFFTELDDLTS